jgi:hypothetical protein
MNMPEVTLESLAKRIEDLERKLAELSAGPKPNDWRSVVGIFEDNEFTRDWEAETLAIRERSRQAAREGRFDQPGDSGLADRRGHV